MLFHPSIDYSSRRPLVCGTVMLVIVLASLGLQVSAFMSGGGPEAIQVTKCTRSFTEDSLRIGVQLKSDCPAAVSIQCRLVVPEEFIERATRDGVYHETPYYNAGPEVMESDWFTMDPQESRVCTFEIPVQSTFIESENYEVVLTWHTEWGLFSGVNQRKTLGVTPFESVDSSSADEYERPDGTFRAAYVPPEPSCEPLLVVTSTSLVDYSLYKGEALHAMITVRNDGGAAGTPYLNVRIRESTKLYIGFDRGVWAFYEPGTTMGSAVDPGYSKTYDLSIGPVLRDTLRGIWALNARVNNDAVSGSVSYELFSVCVETYYSGAWHANYAGCSRVFTVTQNTNTRVVLTAVIDDNYFPSGTDPAQYCEKVMNFPLKIGNKTYTGPVTSFQKEFGLDFMFFNVGQYTWPSWMPRNVHWVEALQATRYALGHQLNLGTDWISSNVNFATESMAPTMRENHGFDLGIGLMAVTNCNGYGVADGILGTCAVAIGNPIWLRVKEVVLHEICHLFGAIHGEAYGTNGLPGTPFGPDKDGLTYVMAGGDGDDFDYLLSDCWRMNPQTCAIIRSLNHLKKFDGADAPAGTGIWLVGQYLCHAAYGPCAPQSQVYRLMDSSNYVEGNGGSLFSRFRVAEDDMQYASGERYWRETVVDANVLAPNWAYFYVAYRLEWGPDHWPTGFSSTSVLKLYFNLSLWHTAYLTASTITNVDIRVNSGLIGTPTSHYSAWFLSSNPAMRSENIYPHSCYKVWGTCNPVPFDVIDSDGIVFLLIGFCDAWADEYDQAVFVHPNKIQYTYHVDTWQ